MAEKTKKFEVTVTVEVDCDKIQEWKDEYPKAEVTKADVQDLVSKALDFWITGGGMADYGMGEGYGPAIDEDPEGASWLASMNAGFKVSFPKYVESE